MKKVKCEICGEMVPQNEMSKSYRHRCKKCVAEITRAQRHAEKQKQAAHENIPHTYDAPAPYGDKPLQDALPKHTYNQTCSTIMKVTITIPKEKVKQVAGAITLISGDDAPDGLAHAIDVTDEVDITETLDKETRDQLYMALSIYVLQKIASPLTDKCKDIKTAK